MDVQSFLNDVRAAAGYADQLVHIREVPARAAEFAEPAAPLHPAIGAMLRRRGIARLYRHQAEAVSHVGAGRDVVVVTGTASGKTLCYVVPIVQSLLADPATTHLLVFPTKALCQDQFRGFSLATEAAGLDGVLAGVYDGDTPAGMRRKLRDQGQVLFTNPDMLHAAIMPEHARWARFLAALRFVVLDELHVYSGIFGSNMTNLLRRFDRVCRHYGAAPRMLACSATIGNPAELAAGLTGRVMQLVERDGSPRGRRTYVFWNPPRVRATDWRSRRSANVEAHELMAMLVQRGVPTITFSKAKMTAEMIHRYVCDTLRRIAPQMVAKVTPYRGGYLPEERRQIERRLFDGELLGVSATRALELGIDVGGLDASILVGYPGTLASFFQQAGRAGRQDRDSLVVLIGLDTSINQYLMSHPEYVFGRPVEQGVIDPDNPFVITGHLRCAAHELALADPELARFGPHAPLVVRVLEENLKLRRVGDRWYHAAAEAPHHELSMRESYEETVTIQDADTGATLGQLDKLDAPPIVHPEAIYMHRGETYRVLSLDLERNLALVKREEVDYYTQPIGGTDVHHIDHTLREKPFGAGRAYWGEVTAYSNTRLYERVRFYSLDAVSTHGVDLPTLALETMAFWLVPPEPLMEAVRRAGLDAHSGLRGIGYATRMILPLFMTCDTLDFSHTIGSANSPWNAIFVYEHYRHGLGFTAKAYERLHTIVPAVREAIRACPCADGCPCCVGKPLRQYSTWNVERGEGAIPSKAAALMILDGLLADGSALFQPDATALCDSDPASATRLEQAIRRRLERGREPRVFHPIEPAVPTAYPAIEKTAELPRADVAQRAARREDFHRRLRRRLAPTGPGLDGLPPGAPRKPVPPGMRLPGGSNKPPTYFPGRPAAPAEPAPPPAAPSPAPAAQRRDDELAAKARRILRQRPQQGPNGKTAG